MKATSGESFVALFAWDAFTLRVDFRCYVLGFLDFLYVGTPIRTDCFYPFWQKQLSSDPETYDEFLRILAVSSEEECAPVEVC